MARALVAGAGVGGLSAALALGAAGLDVAVYERGKTIGEFGAGLQLTPNATRALDKLGALKAVMERAYAPSAVVIRRARTGAVLQRLPLDDSEKRWGAPYLAIHRGDLQAALLQTVLRAKRTRFVLERDIGGIAADGEEVVIGFKRGLLSLSERGDCAVAADGLWSKLRQRLGLGGPNDVTPLDKTAFRAQVPFANARESWLKPEINLHLGPDAHLVHYPLPARQVVNVVGIVRQAPPTTRGGGYDESVSGVAMAEKFLRWGEDARALLAGADTWRAWPLFDRPPVDTYATGRIALLGDSAHPMAPFLGQGAAMAIEDAATLLTALQNEPDLPTAFATYSRERAPRAGRVQLEARKQGEIYHHRGAMALARNVAMRTMGAKRMLARYDWLYGG